MFSRSMNQHMLFHHPATIQASQSAVAVFAVDELLETIIAYLPLKQIIRANRVCRRWKNVIQTSPHIQRALCFRPMEPKMACILGPVYYNHYCRYETRTVIKRDRVSNVSSNQVYRIEATLNELVCRRADWSNHTNGVEYRCALGSEGFGDHTIELRGVVGNIGSRWDMFLCNPPEAAVGIIYQVRHTNEDLSDWSAKRETIVTSVYREEGVRLSEVLKRIQDTLPRFVRRDDGWKLGIVKLCFREVGVGKAFYENGALFLDDQDRTCISIGTTEVLGVRGRQSKAIFENEVSKTPY